MQEIPNEDQVDQINYDQEKKGLGIEPLGVSFQELLRLISKKNTQVKQMRQDFQTCPLVYFDDSGEWQIYFLTKAGMVHAGLRESDWASWKAGAVMYSDNAAQFQDCRKFEKEDMSYFAQDYTAGNVSDFHERFYFKRTNRWSAHSAPKGNDNRQMIDWYLAGLQHNEPSVEAIPLQNPQLFGFEVPQEEVEITQSIPVPYHPNKGFVKEDKTEPLLNMKDPLPYWIDIRNNNPQFANIFKVPPFDIADFAYTPFYHMAFVTGVTVLMPDRFSEDIEATKFLWDRNPDLFANRYIAIETVALEGGWDAAEDAATMLPLPQPIGDIFSAGVRFFSQTFIFPLRGNVAYGKNGHVLPPLYNDVKNEMFKGRWTRAKYFMIGRQWGMWNQPTAEEWYDENQFHQPKQSLLQILNTYIKHLQQRPDSASSTYMLEKMLKFFDLKPQRWDGYTPGGEMGEWNIWR